jgi:hypothetical protein
MSTHESETEKGQGQLLPSFHTQETIPEQATIPSRPSPPPPRPKKRRWFVAGIAALVIVLLLVVSAGAILLTQLGRQPVTPTPMPKPTATTAPITTPVSTTTTQPTATPFPTGQWVQVLTGYRVTSLAAAPSYPNVLYACAIAPGVAVEYRSVQTVLRSADFGAHWQDIGSRAQMSRGCQLAINPTDSYEIYVATSSNPPADPAVPSYVLEHTSNGGDSWETIHAVLTRSATEALVSTLGQTEQKATVYAPSLDALLAWQGTQLRFGGKRLYSLQAVPTSLTPTTQGIQGLTRLVMSTDGGHTWNVLDTPIATTGETAEAYAVNPANLAVFYELAFLPVAPGTGFPPLTLYQSVDGGKTWQSVVKQIPYSSIIPVEILTGSENPNVVYLTNTMCAASQAFHAGGGPVVQLAGSRFSLCMSSDAGKSWRTITAPSQFAYTMGGGVIDQQGQLYTQVTMSGSTEIWHYDPATATWSMVTQAPHDGSVLAGTPTGANGATVLWLMSTSGQIVLYRYVI